MDVAAYLQCFEDSSYTGDDPLDRWDKFVEYLEQKFPPDRRDGMTLVFDRLMQKFINTERYKDDLRYVKYCIKCASSSSDPVALYHHIYSNGVGTKTAALYVSWAQHFEQRGMNEQADAVYQKALENQAQPADAVLTEYRLFQTRRQTCVSAGALNPLQNSQLTNQLSSNGAAAAPNKAQQEVKTTIIVSRSETSGTIPQRSAHPTVSEYMKEELVCEGSELSFEEVRAAKYFQKEKEEEEEKKKKKQERSGPLVLEIGDLDEWLQGYKCESIHKVFPSKLFSKRPPAAQAATYLNPDPTQNPFGRPQPSLALSGSHDQPTFSQNASAVPESADVDPPSSAASHHPSALPDRSVHAPRPAAASPPADQPSVFQTWAIYQPADSEQVTRSLHRPPCVSAEEDEEEPSRPQEHDATRQFVTQQHDPEDNLNVSQGATANLSHITPNTSLGYVQATPSRVLPSPTVNTREALGVIMDMFQAPTLLEDPFGGASMLHAAESKAHQSFSGNAFQGGASSLPKPAAAAAPFTIFQDDGDKENGSVAAPPVVEKSKPIRALSEIPVSNKPNDTPPDLMPDESTMWGARYNSLNSLAACPNSTTDFAMLAQFVSTPSAYKTPVSSNSFQAREIDCDADDEAFTRRHTKKLSPIIEQSPHNETLSETAVGQRAPSSQGRGTIVGEGLASAPSCLTTSSTTMVQPPPPAVLSFRDQTICPTECSVSRTTGRHWEVYTSPPKQTCDPPQTLVRPRCEDFTIMEDLDEPASPERVQKQVYDDVPMSPENALQPEWPAIQSAEETAEPDLDAFLSPRRRSVYNKSTDVPMSPQQPLCADVPMSPGVQQSQLGADDELMMSPYRGGRASADVSMNATPEKTSSAQLVSNPWDDGLIADLLSMLSAPLTSHPRCVTWRCNLPNISPKKTISMGSSSLRVDHVLGEGAFATVYHATDPASSEKMVLKVQKPANPWEFYINTQLDARLRPDVRHFFSNLHSAHFFNNGSVLLGELHNYGTLLNAVNIYKTLSDKVMPQPLVIYFTVCILRMVETLHAIHLVHADIKPDNFMLGERFLENKCFESENADHGLALIDLGQSIDMELFPQGTAFTSRCLTSGFQCTEMLSGKPWSYQTDYFGIAGTVHCMLFGTYMQVTNEDGVWKTNGAFRRNPHSDMWQDFFHTLLNVPACSALPSLHALRCTLASVLQQNYSSKLPSIKSRLVVMLLERHKAARR